MIRTATYSINWNTKGLPEVIIHYGDGFSDSFTEAGLLNAIETVKESRRKYKHEHEWHNAIAIYEGALEHLRSEFAIELRRY